MKRWWPSLFVLLLTHALTLPVAAKFSDLAANHWAYAAIVELADQEIVSGYPDGRFLPDNRVSVGEFYKLMVMAIDPYYVTQGAERPYVEAAATLTNHWAMEYAYRLARLCGVQDLPTVSADRLDAVITRIEMAHLAAVVHRTRTGNKDTLVGSSNVLNRFSDVTGLSSLEQGHLTYCVQNSLISGFDDGTFRPRDGLTRAQAARMTTLVSGGFSSVDKGSLGTSIRKMRTFYTGIVENAGLPPSAFQFCLDTITPYMGWYPQPLMDALAKRCPVIRFSSGEGLHFDWSSGTLTLMLDHDKIGSSADRQAAAARLREGLNYIAGNLVPAERYAASSFSLPIAAERFGEVAELCLLNWNPAADRASGSTVVADAQARGDAQRMVEVETAYLLLCRLFSMTSLDSAKLNPFPAGHTFTVRIP